MSEIPGALHEKGNRHPRALFGGTQVLLCLVAFSDQSTHEVSWLLVHVLPLQVSIKAEVSLKEIPLHEFVGLNPIS